MRQRDRHHDRAHPTVRVVIGLAQVAILPFVHVAWGGSTAGSIDIRTAANADVGHARGGYTECWNDNPAFHTRTGGTTSYVCVRFDNVLIPNGATIDSATVTTYQHENSSDYNSPADDTSVDIEDADDPSAMTDTGFETRQSNGTGNAFTWAQDNEGYLNNDAMTAITLTSALQAVVNRAGWSSGNAVCVWFYHGGNGTRSNGFRPHAAQTTAYTPRLQVSFSY